MKINQNRIIYLDILRSIAIILIVLEHLTRMFVYNYKSWLFASGLFSITRISVPLFFTISGALLLTRQETISNFLKKRLGRIFPPFIFWIIIYIILGIFVWKFQPSLKLFIGIIFGGINFSAHFWFIWGLISAYIFIPILGTFINTYNKDAFKYLIIITFIVSILYTIGLFNYPRLKFDFKVPFYFFSVLGYFILGSYIHNTEFKQSKSKLFGLSILTFIIGLIGHLTLILIKGNATHTLSPIDFLNIFVILETIGLFGIFKFADIKMISSNLKPLKETKLGEIIVLFSNCSFGIYLCHYLIMEYLMYMGFLRPLKRNHIIFNLPIYFIIILALSWILIYIMSKIPYLKIGSGTK